MTIRTSDRLEAIPAYEPGLTTAEVLAKYGLESAVKLASNESPYPPLDAVVEVVRVGADSVNRYPQGAGTALRAALADLHGALPEQIVLGNGSCELILLAGTALLDPGTTVIHPDPSFGLYPHLAEVAGAEGIAVPLDEHGRNDLDAMAAEIDERTRLIIICSPNNPTGAYVPADVIEAFLDAVPEDVAVLIDEAYHDFVTFPDRGRPMTLARTRPNVLVTRTFSKAYGLCGLRVGYGVGSPAWIAALDRVRQPFNTSSVAQAAAFEAIRHQGPMSRRIAQTVSERERVGESLRSMGVTFTESQANFILMTAINGRPFDGPATHEALLRRGVIVRNGASLGVPSGLRVTIGTRDENDAFLAALAELIGAAPAPEDHTRAAGGVDQKGPPSP